ncbi:hypothetical protein BEWA_048730 [Theileria equi strain WA]|uniref:Uncharacterized protein n=1 Tax=Theileria equi strain WA TaxID=1537102 RepID=L1LAQ7_THEEQ|nr:hypothetical protein BEWA_048730 [Theileria equi strain WA]EKX72406.1 hypothetical protein BEWA_048730 [Theileria equi strain WA]|eukprot:XP_004831858.1 hypothetical protein BEWA_048730 [Theileria equi strain WA]
MISFFIDNTWRLKVMNVAKYLKCDIDKATFGLSWKSACKIPHDCLDNPTHFSNFTGSSWYGSRVDIDISKTTAKVGYFDSCRNQINIVKDQERFGNGYKTYTHKAHQGGDLIGGINYAGKDQTGFGNLNTAYNIELTVVYLYHDHDNQIPLVIMLKDSYVSTYYSRNDYFSSPFTWTRDFYFQYQLNPLSQISSKIKDFVVLKLDATNGNYFANGDSKPPEVNGHVRVSVISSIYEGIYDKYTHIPSGGISLLRPFLTIIEHTSIKFSDASYTKPSKEANVYYWSCDKDSVRPLIIELFSGSSTYYKFINDKNNKRWQNVTENTNIKNILDKENCERNKAHQIDISKTTGTTYPCLTPGCNIQITVSDLSISGYSRFSHHISDVSSNLSVARFKDRGVEQTGLPTVKGVHQIIVFSYPKDNRKPLLIHWKVPSSHKWFKRGSPNVNTWNEIDDNDSKKPKDDADHENILRILLDSYSPKVTIDSKTDTQTPYDPDSKPASKEDENGDAKGKVKVTSSSKESPDSSGAVTGGILGGLACLCLLGVLIWKVGPSVRTRLASRQPLL